MGIVAGSINMTWGCVQGLFDPLIVDRYPVFRNTNLSPELKMTVGGNACAYRVGK
jgi:hypothetical protein